MSNLQGCVILLYCPHCGANLPDGAVFCMKCGTRVQNAPNTPNVAQNVQNAPAANQGAEQPKVIPVDNSSGVAKLNCPSCGAPITPKFGEMIITCEYCGTTVTLGNEGWKSIQKQTMLPLTFPEQEQVLAKVHDLMDKGLLHRHVQESSKLVGANLSLVPYWVVSVSARTSIVAVDVGAEAGQIATTAALAGLLGASMGGGRGRGRGGFVAPMATGAMMGGMMGGGRGGTKKTHQMDNNYNFPIIALKALIGQQPKDYQFNLADRTFFDISKMPKGINVLNGDVSEEAAKYEAKTLVDQLQSDKAHKQFHMIQQLHTDVDVSEAELLHAPIWFVNYEHNGKKVSLVIDANSGAVINSIGLER